MTRDDNWYLRLFTRLLAFSNELSLWSPGENVQNSWKDREKEGSDEARNECKVKVVKLVLKSLGMDLIHHPISFFLSFPSFS